VCVLDGRRSLCRDAEETLRPPAPFWSRNPYAGWHVALSFETIYRGIDGADRRFSSGGRFDLAPDGDPVGLITKTQDRQKNNVFEFTEIIAARH
jgi:hypothetical protein